MVAMAMLIEMICRTRHDLHCGNRLVGQRLVKDRNGFLQRSRQCGGETHRGGFPSRDGFDLALMAIKLSIQSH